MDLSRAVYSRDMKIAAMKAPESGSTPGEIARQYQVSPHLLDRWRGEWRAKGDLAFPGIGRRGAGPGAGGGSRRGGGVGGKKRPTARENKFLKKALQHFKDHHPPAVVSGGDVCLKKSNTPRRKAKP